MDMQSLVVAMGAMGGMGALFSAGLALADKKLHVEEDPRIELLVDALPGANCGGCGVPGCGAFAEALVNGKALVNGCPVNNADGVAELAEIMGVEATAGVRQVARVLCAGGDAEVATRGEYLGVKTCLAAHMNHGGEKLCEYGCMGHADCVAVCPFDAIHMNDNGLPVVSDDKCTGCNNCVIACPRDIIELVPENKNLFIFCKSKDEAKHARSVCTVSCVGCAACAKGAGGDLICMDGYLPRIDYSQYGEVDILPTEKCPNNSLRIYGQHSTPTINGLGPKRSLPVEAPVAEDATETSEA
ncbi:MAG: RnfABCDGE type electron transport complex subunit B [bacterium]|nr:RnfABCDGE type electron transport complex subunit B [bacterium]